MKSPLTRPLLRKQTPINLSADRQVKATRALANWQIILYLPDGRQV